MSSYYPPSKKDQPKTLKVLLNLFLIGSGAFVLRWLPTFWAYFQRGNRIFMGIVSLTNLMDAWSYWANILEGLKGHWLFINPFGEGPAVKYFLYFPYLFLGHLAKLLYLKVEVAYLLAAYFLAIILAISLFYFSSHFFKSLRWRYFVVIMCLISNGILCFPAPESIPFLSLTEPHFILAQICMVLIFHFFLKYETQIYKKEKIRIFLLIFILSLVLSLVHVFINWLIIMILFFWLGINYFSKKQNISESLNLFFLLLVMVLGSLPLSINSLLLTKNPFFTRIFINQNTLPSPAPLVVISQFGIAVFFIPFALKFLLKNRKVIFLFIWFLIQFLAAYFPVRWQLRFFEGWWIPCFFLICLEVSYFWQNYGQKIPLFKFFLVVFIFSPFLVVNFCLVWIEMSFWSSELGKDTFYVSQAQVESWKYLESKCDFDKIVLSDFPRGVYLPAKTGCRSFIGHSVQTFDFFNQEAQFEKILNGEMSSDWLEKYLIKGEINYVLLPKEKAQKAQLDQAKNLKLVFGNQEFVIFERI